MEEFSKYIMAAVINHGYNAYLDVAEFLNEESFPTSRDEALWFVFKNIYEGNSPPTRATGAEYVAMANQIGLGTEVRDNNSYLRELSKIRTESDAVIRAAKTLKKDQIRRDLINKAEGIVEELMKMRIDSDTQIDKIISSAESPILDYVSSLNMNTNQVKLLSDGAREHIYSLINEPREYIGIPSFIDPWNAAVGGGYRPGIHILSARRKKGKSSHAMCDAKFVGGLGIPVLYLDREMVAEVAQVRLAASLGRVNTLDIEHGRINPGDRKHTSLNKGLDKFEQLPIYYANIAPYSIDEIVSLIRRWLIRHVGYGENGKMNPCLIIYDYIKITSSTEVSNAVKEYQAVAFYANKLADMGLKYGISVSCYTQSNKEDDVSMSDRLSHIGNSVSFLREPDSTEQQAKPNLGNRRLYLECTRFGPGFGPDDFVAMNLEGEYATLNVLGMGSQLGMAAPPEKNGDVEF